MRRCLWVALGVALASDLASGQENFKRTDSGRAYAHWIELHDHDGRVVDPRAPDPSPFSMRATCKTCHDIATIEHGWHFSTRDDSGDAARNGEPWILTDPRTGTQIPLSLRGWKGTWRPDQVGIDAFRFVREFGSHLPGGAPAYTGVTGEEGRFRVSGTLDIDCMVCHGRDSSWSHERWAKAIDAQNLAWASATALGLIAVDGSAKSLPDDLDPSTAEGRAQLPKTRYDLSRFGPDGRVFFDVVRTPANEACATCHGAQPVGANATPRWLHDSDIHLRAGMRCADCHRNGLAHDTVRGFEGERHPSGVAVDSLTCRGCHTDASDGHGNVTRLGGRLGAPLALHRGLPAVHLEKLSCTACHSGPRPSPAPGSTVSDVQTALAHALGVPSQTRAATDLPAIVEPVLARDEDGVIRPHRETWPSFWGFLVDGSIEPLDPDLAFGTVRRALRVRRDLMAELGTGDEARAKIAAGLTAFSKTREGAVPVFVSGGRAWRLDATGEGIESFAHSTADSVRWPIAHDVRPARDALGARGCTECHASDAPFVHTEIVARSVVPDPSPLRTTALVEMQLDPTLVEAWETSFRGRDLFKWTGLAALGVVALVLLLHLAAIVFAMVRRVTGEDPGAAT